MNFKKYLLLLLTACFVLVASNVQPSRAHTDDKKMEKMVEKIVKKYLSNHPEVIYSALTKQKRPLKNIKRIFSIIRSRLLLDLKMPPLRL